MPIAHRAALVSLANGTIAALTTVPANPGDVLILRATDFGPATPVTVTIDKVAAAFYGPAFPPGFAGLYQVAIQVPVSLANGDWPIVATAGSAALLNATPSPAGVILTVHN